MTATTITGSASAPARLANRPKGLVEVGRQAHPRPSRASMWLPDAVVAGGGGEGCWPGALGELTSN